MITIDHNSSWIGQVNYDETTATLYFQLSAGVYAYYDVPRERIAHLKTAITNGQSLGAYFNKHIKPNYQSSNGSPPAAGSGTSPSTQTVNNIHDIFAQHNEKLVAKIKQTESTGTAMDVSRALSCKKLHKKPNKFALFNAKSNFRYTELSSVEIRSHGKSKQKLALFSK